MQFHFLQSYTLLVSSYAQYKCHTLSILSLASPLAIELQRVSYNSEQRVQSSEKISKNHLSNIFVILIYVKFMCEIYQIILFCVGGFQLDIP